MKEMHVLKRKATTRDKYLRVKYGITQAVYLEMLAVCDGGCWICLKKPKPGKNLHVDHVHDQSKRIRGLLCWLCNRKLIGRHKLEHAWKFEAAAAYLRSTKDWRC